MATQKKGLDLLLAGTVGAVVGAVGSLVGVFLSDEKNRDKVVKEAKVLKAEGSKKFKELEKKAKLLKVKKSSRRK